MDNLRRNRIRFRDREDSSLRDQRHARIPSTEGPLKTGTMRGEAVRGNCRFPHYCLQAAMADAYQGIFIAPADVSDVDASGVQPPSIPRSQIQYLHFTADDEPITADGFYHGDTAALGRCGGIADLILRLIKIARRRALEIDDHQPRCVPRALAVRR